MRCLLKPGESVEKLRIVRIFRIGPKYRFRPFSLLLLLCLLIPSVPAIAGAETPPVPQTAPKILLISSFHLSHKWTMEANNVIMRELDAMENAPIIDYLELNAVRNRTSDFVGKFEPYRRLIQERKYDMVVAVLDDAINLLIENLDTIPSDLPIVFCGYQEMPPEFTLRHPNITGVAIDFQVMETIEMGLALMPDTREIAVVTDDLPSGLLIHRRVQAETAGFNRCKITLINGAEYSTPRMLEAVRAMPEQSFVVFCPWRNYARDGYASLINVGEDIAKTGRPYLVVTDVLLGKGALGGRMSLGESGGWETARLIRRVLNKNSAGAIPFIHDNGEFAADMAVMKKFGLPEKLLPPGTLAINRSIPLWESHRETVIAVAAALFLLAALIVAITVFHLRFRRLTRRMQTEQDSMIARLDNHVSNERIFNLCLQRITIEEDSRKAVQKMLEAIGIRLGADRTYIFQYRDGTCADNIYEWSAPGISPQKENLQNLDMGRFPRVQEVFLEKQPLKITEASHPDPGIQDFAEFLRGRAIRSALLCGIREQGKLWGFIGMDFVRAPHAFTESDRQMLDNAINLFLLARERRRQMEAISEGAFRQKQIFDSITIPIAMFDLDYNITMVNPASCRAAGKSQEELLGRKCYRMLCGRDTLPEWCPIHRVLTEKMPRQFNFDGDGNRRYLVTLQPIFDRENQLTGILENALDITDLFNQKREQEVTNEFLRRAGEIAGITCFRSNVAETINLLGGSGTNIGGLKNNGTFEDWLTPEDRPAFQEEKEALVSGRRELMELICHSAASGMERTYKLYAAAYSRTEDIYLGILQDITGPMKLESEKNDLILRQKAYVENEKIINACLTLLVRDENFDRNVNGILETLANQLDGDRAYYGCYAPDGSDYGITHEWRNAGVPSMHEVRDPRFREQFLYWKEQLEKDELLEIPDIPGSPFAEILREPGCRTLLCAPVIVNRRLAGIIGLGFIRHRRDITEFDENTIRSVAQIISLALRRDAKHRELEEAIGDREAVFRNISMPIMLFDQTGKLVRVNPAACIMAGRNETEILAHPCNRSFCHQESEPVWCPVRQAFATGKSAEVEFELHGREYAIKAEPVFDEAGTIRNIIENAIDITEVNASRRQLEKAVRAEQAANRTKSYFLATMSHEIRTPLNAVIGFSELLKNGGLAPEEQAEYLDSINLAGNSLLRLINDVRDLSKLEAEQTILTPQPTDLAELFREIEAIFQYKVREKKLFFRTSIRGMLPVLNLDSLRLRQILLNLIGNAVKFTEYGGVTLEVDFRRPDGPERGTLTIRVRDTGIGIVPEAQRNIFEPFVQADVARDTHVYKGTGLGLTICRRLVERMNGVISLESEPGAGSCFTIELPGVETTGAAEEDGRRSDPLPRPPSNRRILLVDDVPMNLKVLSALLRKAGMEPVAASSGDEALRILEREQPDLVLTDIWMPGMSGPELAREIRKHPRFRDLPVVAVTADIEVGTNFALEDFSGVLLKPVTIEKIGKLLEFSWSAGVTFTTI